MGTLAVVPVVWCTHSRADRLEAQSLRVVFPSLHTVLCRRPLWCSEQHGDARAQLAEAQAEAERLKRELERAEAQLAAEVTISVSRLLRLPALEALL